jgi:hypothetical protein
MVLRMVFQSGLVKEKRLATQGHREVEFGGICGMAEVLECGIELSVFFCRLSVFAGQKTWKGGNQYEGAGRCREAGLTSACFTGSSIRVHSSSVSPGGY